MVNINHCTSNYAVEINMLLHCVVAYCFCCKDRDKNHSAENDCYEHAEVVACRSSCMHIVHFTLTILTVSSFICSKREMLNRKFISGVHAINRQPAHSLMHSYRSCMHCHWTKTIICFASILLQKPNDGIVSLFSAKACRLLRGVNATLLS